MAAESYDFVICGGGSAGCALAERLTKNGLFSVALLEAGDWDKKMEIHMPGVAQELQHSEVDWKFITEPQEHLGNRKVALEAALPLTIWYIASVTSTTLIDGQLNLVVVRTGAGSSEKFPERKSPYHGTSGPLVVCSVEQPNIAAETFVNAAIETGVPFNEDYNGEKQHGVSYAQVTINKGKRCSNSQSYLSKASGRKNLTVLTNAHVGRVLFNADKVAVAVEVSINHVRRTIKATREILLSCGTVHTAQLLLLSGIGPKEQLEQLGVDCLVDSPVGQNLQDHLQVPIIIAAKRELTPNAETGKTLANLGNYFFFKRGPMVTNNVEALAHLDSSLSTHATPDTLVTLTSTLPVLHILGQMYDTAPTTSEWPAHGFVVTVVGLHPKSKGSISLQSLDPVTPVGINPNYLSEADDYTVLLEGVKTARKILGTKAFSELFSNEVVFTDIPFSPESEAYIKELIRRHATTFWQPVGTCKMGAEEDTTAVVTPQLKVKGTTHLRVVDASIIPEAPSGFLNGVVTMLAEKASDMIITDIYS